MPLRVPQQAAVARLIVLPTPQQPMVEADTEAANTVNQQVLTVIVAANHKPEAAEPDSSAAFAFAIAAPADLMAWHPSRTE